jgi:hypothetical protein
MATSLTDTTFCEVAARLLDNAWRPLPVIGKQPAMAGWAALCHMPWDYDDLIAATHDYAGNYSCGIAADPTHVFIDTDVLDETLATNIGALAEETFGRTPLIRIGLAPKWVRIYRTRPGEAIRSRKAHPVEVMCGSGMIVAYGKHPDTGEPYHWITGHSALTTTANSGDIPLISSTQLMKFLTTAHGLLGRAHYGVSGQARGSVRHLARLPPDIHQELRLLALQIGFERAAIRLLQSAINGSQRRHLTMWATVCAASGRGWDEGRLVHLFERHFAGWDGVSREAFEHALNQVYRGGYDV